MKKMESERKKGEDLGRLYSELLHLMRPQTVSKDQSVIEYVVA